MVQGVAVVSRGAVASVALYTRCPVEALRTIALDTSSRTSVALIKVLCHHHFQIRPKFVPHGPDLAAMIREYDAGLLIGDPALEADHQALNVHKIDLGIEWTTLTGLPFVYAAWTGRSGAVTVDDIRGLQEAGEEGSRATDVIAAEYGRGDAAATTRARVYLRDNVKYTFGPEEIEGLQTFLDYAADLGLAPRHRRVEFF
jgi:chorismate dehydratase